MYCLRSVVLGQDGQLHKVLLEHVTNRLRFDAEPLVSMSFIGNSLQLDVDADGDCYAAVNRWDTGQSELVWQDGQSKTIPEGNGAYTAALIALGDRAELYALCKDQSGVDRFDSLGAKLEHYNVPYASTGIHRIDPDGYPVTETDPRRREARTLQTKIGPVLLRNCDEHAGYTVGHPQDGGWIDGRVRPVLALVEPDGTILMWPYPTDQSPQNPRVAVKAGEKPWIAASNEGTPEPDELYDLMVPFVSPPVAPPVEPVPTVKPAITLKLGPAPPDMPAIWIGLVTDRPGMPGNCAWDGASGEKKPVTTTAKWRELVEGKTLLCGLWLSDNGAAPETIDPEIAFAKEKGAPAVYLHEDAQNQRADVDKAAERARAAGLLPVVATNVNNGEAVRVLPSYGVTLNVRTFGKDYPSMAAGIVAAVKTIREKPGCVIVFVYGWFDHALDEAESLDERWPDLARYLREVIGLVETPSRLPGEPAPVPARPAKKETFLERLRRLAAERDPSRPSKRPWWKFW